MITAPLWSVVSMPAQQPSVKADLLSGILSSCFDKHTSAESRSVSASHFPSDECFSVISSLLFSHFGCFSRIFFFLCCLFVSLCVKLVELLKRVYGCQSCISICSIWTSSCIPNATTRREGGTEKHGLNSVFIPKARQMFSSNTLVLETHK